MKSLSKNLSAQIYEQKSTL